VLRALQKAGFEIHHQSGSHAQLKHPGKPQLRVTVPRRDRFWFAHSRLAEHHSAGGHDRGRVVEILV